MAKHGNKTKRTSSDIFSESFQRSRSFKDFESLATYAKGMVYSITRLRGDMVSSIGTGFLAGNGVMMSCSHCFNKPTHAGDPRHQHQDGDLYMLIQRNDMRQQRIRYAKPHLDKSLFLYPEQDIAVFYLDDAFYEGSETLPPLSRDAYFQFDTRQNVVGTEVGMLGYPASNVKWVPDGSVPDIGGVTLRAGKGIITGHNLNSENLRRYEMDIAFQPGNSGGPVFNAKTGAVIGVANMYRDIKLDWAKDTMPPHTLDNDEEVVQYAQMRANYSYAISSETVLEIASQHGLMKY